MKSAPHPPNETARIEALRQTGILDTPPEEEFDELARMASRICAAPIALISLVDADRQWFKARLGLQAAETPRDLAFCAHAILGEDVFIVQDAVKDDRFADNPLVNTDPFIRFYAGAPLVTPDGCALGTLCVIARVPRMLEPAQIESLRALARLAVGQIVLRRGARMFSTQRDRLESSEREAREAGAARDRLQGLLDETGDLVQTSGRDGRLVFVNAAWKRSLGYDDDDVRRAMLWDVVPTGAAGVFRQIFERLPADGVVDHLKTTLIAKDGRRVRVEGCVRWEDRGTDGPGLMRAVFRDVTWKKMAEEELDAFFSVSTDMLCLAGFDGLFKRLNPVWCRALGYTESELLSRPYLDFVHPDDVVATMAEASRLASGEATVAFENRYVCRDGSFKWLSWTAAPSLERGVIIASARDVTEQRRLEQRVHETTVLQRAILDSPNDAIVATSPDGIITVFNETAGRWLGYEPAEVIGKGTLPVFLDPEELAARALALSAQLGRTVEPGLDALVAKALGGETGEIEWMWVRRDGSRFPVNLTVTVMRDGSGDITGYLAIGRDTSDRRRAQEALRASEGRNRALLDAVPDSMILVSREGTVLDRKVGRQSTLLAAGADIVGKSLREVLPAGLVPEFLQRLERALSTGDIEIFEHRRTGEGATSDTEFRLVSAGRNEVLVLARDITERKENDRLKSEFVSTVSHELRTPLTSIRGSLKLLENGVAGELPGEAVDLVRIARTSAERLIRLINDILDLERIAAGRMELSLRDLDPQVLGRSALDSVAAMAAAAGVELRADVKSRELVRGDEGRLLQVLTNLLTNAIKYSPSGAAVDLVVSARSNGAVRFSVIDRGPGIPRDQQHRLFRQFVQLDASDSREKGGTGLGLAICKSVVEHHGGEIGVASEPGRGCEFWFEVPAIDPLDVESEDDPADIARPIVLVIEDDDRLARSLRRKLSLGGTASCEPVPSSARRRSSVDAGRRPSCSTSAFPRAMASTSWPACVSAPRPPRFPSSSSPAVRAGAQKERRTENGGGPQGPRAPDFRRSATAHKRRAPQTTEPARRPGAMRRPLPLFAPEALTRLIAVTPPRVASRPGVPRRPMAPSRPTALLKQTAPTKARRSATRGWWTG